MIENIVGREEEETHDLDSVEYLQNPFNLMDYIVDLSIQNDSVGFGEAPLLLPSHRSYRQYLLENNKLVTSEKNKSQLEKRAIVGRLRELEEISQSSDAVLLLNLLSDKIQNDEVLDEKREELFYQSIHFADIIAHGAVFDPKIQLFSMPGIIEVGAAHLLACINDENPEVMLQDTVIIMSDMVLFHFGNQSLGEKKFDERVALLASGYRDMARFLADDVNNDLYPPFTESEDIESSKGMREYFKKNSPLRIVLESLKGKVKIAPIRLNAGGGDEFCVCIQRIGQGTTEDIKKASEIIRNITRSTSLVPGVAVLRGEDEMKDLSQEERNRRSMLYRIFCNSLAKLTLDGLNIESPPQKVDLLNKFTLLFRWYLLEDPIIFNAFMEPHNNVVMDYIQAELIEGELPTLNDAIYKFFAEHEIYKFYSGDGHPNLGTIQSYSLDLAKKAAFQFSSFENLNIEDKYQITLRTLARDICDNFFNSLNEHNGKRKGSKKEEILIRAYMGSIRDAFLVAATLDSNREIVSFPDDKSKTTFVEKLIQIYEQRVFLENNLSDNPNPVLLQFYKAWEREKEKINYYNQTDQEKVDTSFTYKGFSTRFRISVAIPPHKC